MLERLHRSTREPLDEVELQTPSRARALIGCGVELYNTERLHAPLCYLPPEEYYRSDPEARLEERRGRISAEALQARPCCSGLFGLVLM